MGSKWIGGGSSIYLKFQSILCDIFYSQSSLGVYSFVEQKYHTVLGLSYYPVRQRVGLLDCMPFAGIQPGFAGPLGGMEFLGCRSSQTREASLS